MERSTTTHPVPTSAAHPPTPAGEWHPTGKAQTTITVAVFAVWVLFAAAVAAIFLRRRRAAQRRTRSEANLEAAAAAPRNAHAAASRPMSRLTLTAPQLALLPAMAFSDYTRANVRSQKADAVAIDIPACAICLDDFKQTCLVRVLACSHVFHAGCVDRWLLKRSCRCPLCNSDTRGIPPQPRKPSSAKLAD
ncbi:hypothetical protein H4R19_002464 [Coemansia spiralis]|nr:hypothetical protein H4R19_002464 [Coemansia spiralis]